MGNGFQCQEKKDLASKGKLLHNSLHGHELEIVEEVNYLEVIIQSYMKFTAHIRRKLMTANQQR